MLAYQTYLLTSSRWPLAPLFFLIAAACACNGFIKCILLQGQQAVLLPTFYSEDTPASANETWARLHSDPLFAVGTAALLVLFPAPCCKHVELPKATTEEMRHVLHANLAHEAGCLQPS